MNNPRSKRPTSAELQEQRKLIQLINSTDTLAGIGYIL